MASLVAMHIIFLVLSLLHGAGAQSPSPSPPPPRPPPPSPPPAAPPGSMSDVGPMVDCPTDPLQLCDFYVTGYRNTLPMLNLDSRSDQKLSGLLRDRFHNETDPDGIVEVDSSSDALFMCPAPTGTDSTGKHPQLSNCFYSTNVNNQAYISSRNNQQYLNQMQVRCVVLKLTSMQVYMIPKERGGITNLNINDRNTFFPEKRRCVAFLTGPTMPVCNRCPAKIANTPPKDLFPLTSTDSALIKGNCSASLYPSNSHACPVQGTCAFPNVTCPAASATNLDGYYGGTILRPYGCPRPLHVQMSIADVQRCDAGTYLKTSTSTDRYYCGSSSTDAAGCQAICRGQPWCKSFVFVVPNGDGDSAKCNNNTGGGKGYIRQQGCSGDIVTPYYGGCGWCFLVDKDYCSPTCNNFGLDSTTAPNNLTNVYWALYGRVGCSYAKNDPHFVGADGTQFEFNGLPEQSFCLVSDARLHINMKMHGYYDTRRVGASVLKDGKAVRTWMRELGIMWKMQNAGGEVKIHTLLLVARRGKQQAYGQGFLASANLDGKVLPKMGDGETLSFPDQGLQLTFEGSSKYGPYDMDNYKLSIPGLLELGLKLRLAHPLLQSTTDAEAHFNIMLHSVAHSERVHGVVGQTYRSGRTTRAIEYSLLGALLGHPVAADGPSGLGYLDGMTSDYVASSILTPDCKFTQFDSTL